uniref:PAR12 polymerase n=1 Tax=Junco hyemalis TaxID=40217 RepID=A0A8C5IY09_JUNHY
MCDPAVSSFLTQTLCAHGGRLGLRELQENVGLSALQLQDTLSAAGPRRFLLLEGGQVVLAVTDARVCVRKECDGCDRLHLCKQHLMGRCHLGPSSCKYSHDIMNAENKKVLKNHDLSGLSENELQVLLLQNDAFFLPDTCQLYNKKGCHCKHQSNCNKLHVCYYFLKGKCKFPQCLISHNLLDDHALRLLETVGIDGKIASNFQAIYDYKHVEFNRAPKKVYGKLQETVVLIMILSLIEVETVLALPPKSKTRENQNRTCIFSTLRLSLLGFGISNENRVLKTRGVCFCSLIKKSNIYIYYIYLYIYIYIYTLPNLIERTPVVVLVWTSTTSPSSAVIENLYQADPCAIVPFQAGQHQYELNFKEMIQTNTHFKTRRQVCRRPKFVSPEDVQKIKTGQRDSSIPNQSCPSHWDASALPDFGYKAVVISNTTSEYNEIKQLFHQTMKNYSILKIQRIQNPSLWKVFQWQKEKMKKENGGKEVQEKRLFHGADVTFMETVCSQNFDWRICGSNGTNYGKGSYFARDACYSHTYCQSTLQGHSMFVARVLVGDYVKGNAAYVRPPMKCAAKLWLYDSCVDNEFNPAVFVVFEKHQIYPEYIIEYREERISVQKDTGISVQKETGTRVSREEARKCVIS